MYADDVSSPFRDTNHEPEIWLQSRHKWQILGLTNSVSQIGFNHQSNGRGGDLSRSWNRIFVNFIFEKTNFALSIKPWIDIGENKDNPDIDDFLGYGEIRAGYAWKDHTLGIMIRNVLESSFEKGTVELSWSFPLWSYEYLRGYVQYFNGYGESLVDYDRHANTIGVGVSVTDFL
ncbi:MAG: phospholipase A1 [Desulforhopalus sp.]